ncbi:hypothetical protein HDU97_004996 [Phlyctochytrium planicorne]|nr:hypothetical protein HDU97_004996 [Phlyctochytrium planicorne]
MESRICKFFLQGRCVRGDSCPFSHGDTLIHSVARSPSPASSKPHHHANRPSSPSDPPLHHRQRQNDDARYHTSENSPTSLAAFPKLSLAPSPAPTSSPGPSPKSKRGSNGSGNHHGSNNEPDGGPVKGVPAPRLTPRIDLLAPVGKYNEAVKKQIPAGSSAGKLANGVATVAPAGTSKRLMSKEGKVKVGQSVGWMSTGSTVDALYTKVRKDAAAAAVERNKLFQRATEAYLAGNKAAAKRFSLQAHEVNEVMEELHREASERIFEARNGKLGVARAASEDERVVDLHGLHGHEAMHYVSTALEQLKRERFRGLVSLVTGTGHHSRSAIAKVAPVVRQLLRSKGYTFKEGVMEGDEHGGIFVVYME